MNIKENSRILKLSYIFNNYEKALKMGMAAGAATANSIFLATKEEIYRLFN